ncbi:unnamed protein product [Adineta steineri]|uniref:Uncharacterized protein n=1 Tax=Adineta steineri TaxID=433720 RepID=A0A818G3V4_9BILA|nr:unnamed protein product [Adineta steineri]CAF3485536.1 unnamed protein product [Adineta steineri]
MRSNILLLFIFVTIGVCLWLMPTSTEAYPFQRNNFGRCPPCNLYCPCGFVLDGKACPSCRCRPSNTCTGRHPNAFGQWPFIKSKIVY